MVLFTVLSFQQAIKQTPSNILILNYFFEHFRPIAGHANLCPSSISTKRQELDILLSTVKHEMLHALGFSVSLFAFYRDKVYTAFVSRLSSFAVPKFTRIK